MSEVNPFVPGQGLPPPHLGGRDAEQEVFLQAMQALDAGVSTGSIVMYGPRGMGKTTLLGWVEEQCSKRRPRITCISSSPSSSDIQGNLPALLLPGSIISVEVLTKIPFISAAWKKNKVDHTGLAKALARKCRRRPRILLMDEAHTMEPDALRILVNVAQETANKAPFLLVLAGTPGLRQLLRESRVTHIERAELMGIGPISTESVKDVIRIPMAAEGVQVSDDLLEEVAKDSQCYPFFVQRWGRALWRTAKDNNLTELDMSNQAAVASTVEKERRQFYAGRYDGMVNDSALMAAATAVGKLLQERGKAEELDILQVVEAALVDEIANKEERKEKALELKAALNRMDYIWRPPDEEKFEPGIPSFMTYILERYAKRSATP
ncbi:MAG: AAA family ATPase [Pseudohongiellaceae bacterium]